MKFGICTDVNGLTACIMEYFDYVELYFTSVMDLTPKKFNELVENNRNLSISIEAAIIRIPPFVKIVASKNDYDFALFYFEKCLERARKLNISKITIGSGDARTADLDNKYEYDMLCSFFLDIDRLCSDYQYRIGIEAISKNMCSTFTTIQSIESFICSSGLKNIGVTIDLFHMYENGDDICEIAKMHSLYHVHLCNPINRELPVKYDRQPYGRIFNFLKKNNYIDGISIESTSKDFNNAICNSIIFIRTIFNNSR